MSAREDLVRLSTFVVFVDYGEEVEVQHTVRGTTCRIDRATYDDLLRFCNFRETGGTHKRWRDAGVLVPPFCDRPAYHGGLEPGTEAALAQDYQDWYWKHEIESEREYRWLGRTVLKMPSALFFYQELIVADGLRSVLEIGHGDGGGLWFFGSVLSMLGGGHVAGVDWDGARTIPEFAQLPDVTLRLVHGDAHADETVERVLAERPGGFDLVVIDAERTPAGKLRLLSRWAELVAPGGFLALEDVTSPACDRGDEAIASGIDRFLLSHRGFAIAVEAGRAPLLKARGATFQREATPAR